MLKSYELETRSNRPEPQGPVPWTDGIAGRPGNPDTHIAQPPQCKIAEQIEGQHGRPACTNTHEGAGLQSSLGGHGRPHMTMELEEADPYVGTQYRSPSCTHCALISRSLMAKSLRAEAASAPSPKPYNQRRDGGATFVSESSVGGGTARHEILKNGQVLLMMRRANDRLSCAQLSHQ